MGLKTLLAQSLLASTVAAQSLSSAIRGATATQTFVQLPQATSGGDDPTNVFDNYCNRVNHQSVAKGGSVYIDSGVQTFANYTYNDPFTFQKQANSTITGYNLYMIELPVDKSWDWQKNLTTQIAYEKTAEPGTNQPAPQVTDGALFSGPANDQRIWLWGGTTSYWNTSFPGFTGPASSSLNLWSWDRSTHVWNSYKTPNITSRTYLGYRADAPSVGLGFHLGGILNSGSSSETQSFGDGKDVFVDGMIVLNFTVPSKPTTRNISTSALGWPRAGGSGVFVPNFGSHGLAVFMGGGNKSTFNLDGNEQGSNAIPMSEITVFDAAFLYGNGSDNNASSAWFRQTASGDIPDPRYRFCTAGKATTDNGTYTIYMMGGRKDSTYYDQLYALSLPSFTWVKLWQGTSPRAGLTCHIINNREFMTFGGAAEYDITQCDWEKRGVAVYDIPTSNWTTTHVGASTSGQAGIYALPKQVVDVIGGSPSGGATKLDPDEGWASPALASLMGRQVANSGNGGTTGSGNNESKGISGGAIAGVVIGVLVILALLAGLAFFLLRRRKQRYTAANAADADTDPAGHSELSGAAASAGVSGSEKAYGAGTVAEKDAGYAAKHHAEVPGDHPIVEAPGSMNHLVHEAPAAPAYSELPAGQHGTQEPQELWTESRHR